MASFAAPPLLKSKSSLPESKKEEPQLTSQATFGFGAPNLKPVSGFGDKPSGGFGDKPTSGFGGIAAANPSSTFGSMSAADIAAKTKKDEPKTG